jgi:IS1 family transposase
MANILPRSKQLAVIGALVEGCSIRSVERMTGIHRDTIMHLGARVGEGCAELLDETMRDLPCERLELDELWAFVGKKERHVKESDNASRVGDQWTWVAIDAETKLVPSFMTGKRDAVTANAFIKDLAARLRYRVQVTTDGLKTYVEPIAVAFGPDGVDYAQLHKTYEAEAAGPALHFAHYNLVRIHSTIRCTPAMAAGVASTVWSMDELLDAALARTEAS